MEMSWYRKSWQYNVSHSCLKSQTANDKPSHSWLGSIILLSTTPWFTSTRCPCWQKSYVLQSCIWNPLWPMVESLLFLWLWFSCTKIYWKSCMPCQISPAQQTNIPPRPLAIISFLWPEKKLPIQWRSPGQSGCSKPIVVIPTEF